MEEFLRQYGTKTTSMTLRRLANLVDAGECAPTDELTTLARELATALEEALNDFAGRDRP